MPKKLMFKGNKLISMSSGALALRSPIIIMNGNLTGTVENLTTSQNIDDANITLDGTSFAAITDSNGSFSFTDVPAGFYTLRVTHSDFLDYSLSVEVVANQTVNAQIQLNPAIVYSTEGNTGWFSKYYPFADANGEFGETSLEMPITINSSALDFVKAEIKFIGHYQFSGSARIRPFLATFQQAVPETPEQDQGSWWVANSATLGESLGERFAINHPDNPGAGELSVFDISDFVRNNPSNIYFLVVRNIDLANVGISDIQITVYYRESFD